MRFLLLILDPMFFGMSLIATTRGLQVHVSFVVSPAWFLLSSTLVRFSKRGILTIVQKLFNGPSTFTMHLFVSGLESRPCFMLRVLLVGAGSFLSGGD